MSTNTIGQSVRRTEDHRFLTGRGQFIDDIAFDGMVHAVVLRSPYAHAAIKAIDTSDADTSDGILLVVTGQDWLARGYGVIPSKSAVRTKIDGSPFAEPPRHCLAIDRVRYVGEAVALVVAETAEQAKSAMELIDVDYDDLDSVTDAAKALTEGAPQIWDDISGNLCLDYQLGDKDGTDKAFAEADHVISLNLVNNRVTAVPLEPRGAVARYDAETDRFELYNATQNVHANRDTFAENVLNIPSEKLHHIAPDVGGGFGAKNGAYPEPPLILHAARELNRPVKWINDRSESFLSDTHGRDQISTVHIALDKDGTFRALKTETIGNLGAYCATVGPFTATGGSARTQGGPYAFDAIFYSARAAFTNTAPTDPYRGAGRPEATFQVERIIEYAARKLGFDPVELRRKNLMPKTALPLKTSMGLDIDCGDFPEVFERTLKMSDRSSYGKRSAASLTAGKRRGFAIAPYLECTGGAPKEYAGVTFDKDGTVNLAVGSQSTGMGHETALPQILAAKLGIAQDRIKFVQADTDATPHGGGHGGSRGLELGGNAVAQSSDLIVDKAKQLAAHLLDTGEDDVGFEDGLFRAASTNKTLSMDDVIDASLVDDLPDPFEPGHLNTGSSFERGIISIPNGCHATEVEVDVETGTVSIDGYWVVDDFGTIVNPLLADGQVMGGIAQGIGQALSENIVYDDDSGQLLSGSLVDYALPRCDSIPRMIIDYYEGAPTAKNPLGVKGAGEAGCVGAPPVIINAILDALGEFGVDHIELPATPEKIWSAVQNAKSTT
jgi:carbon-monoxide dehydrogenase large subunit